MQAKTWRTLQVDKMNRKHEKLRCITEDCNEGRLCILHANNQSKDIAEFSKAIDDLIEKYEKTKELILFDRIIFPDLYPIIKTWDCPVLFNDCIFKGEADFANAYFEKEVEFKNVTFQKVVNFSNATFNENVSFINPIFKGEASFDNVNFEKESRFVKSVFMKEASFIDTTFGRMVFFISNAFQADTDFSSAKFMYNACFKDDSFKENASFRGAKFEGEVIFEDIRFNGMVNMGANFRSKAIFRSFKSDKDDLMFSKSTSVSFCQAIFMEPHLIEFAEVDFSSCDLRKADLRTIDFSLVTWKECGMRYWRRKCLYRHPDATDEELEAVYRQIRQSYEDRKNYPEAGDFYYGEMELKRKKYWWRRYLPSLTSLYWLCSGYGQSPLQAGFLLVILLFVFTEINLQEGALPTNSAPPALLSNLWNLFWFYTLRTITFASPYFKPRYLWGEIVTEIFRLMIPIQTALFVLAVNREFKR